MVEEEFKKGEIIIYKSPQGPEIQVKLEQDTVWLDANLIAKLFDVNRPAIVKHINNIYKTGELDKQSTCSILEQVAADGKVRKMNLYNLDMIISVGYRVNSKRATQFRIWATKTLKEHLVKGYTINEKRLLQTQNQLRDLQNAISFLQQKAQHVIIRVKKELIERKEAAELFGKEVGGKLKAILGNIYQTFDGKDPIFFHGRKSGSSFIFYYKRSSIC